MIEPFASLAHRSLGLRFLGGSLALVISAGAAHARGDLSFEPGAVYTSTNDREANMVVAFHRGVDGVVTFDKLIPTGGRGTGEGLGNQGGLILTTDERYLIVVNAGSDELSVFRILQDDLLLIDISTAFGDMPVSVAQHDDLVYVVNDASDTIAGFRLHGDGTLTHVQGSVKPLSSAGADPAQIGFSPDGRFLYVTEKATSLISVFEVDATGAPRGHTTQASLGKTPFGFAFGGRDQLFVSEAAEGMDGAGSVSSYLSGPAGALRPVSPTVAALGTATCWVLPSPDGRRIFATNTGSDTISTFTVAFEGGLTLLDPQAAQTDDGPIDMALTAEGRFLYVLNGTAGSIGDYRVESGATLTSLPGSNGGLPMFASGLAAR
jgi:6-phosphogluconolactonase